MLIEAFTFEKPTNAYFKKFTRTNEYAKVNLYMHVKPMFNAQNNFYTRFKPHKDKLHVKHENSSDQPFSLTTRAPSRSRGKGAPNANRVRNREKTRKLGGSNPHVPFWLE
jgi:hypothetical protein